VVALLLLPLCKLLEKLGLNRAVAAVIGILLLAGLFTGLFYLLSWQLRDILQDSGQLKELRHHLKEESSVKYDVYALAGPDHRFLTVVIHLKDINYKDTGGVNYRSCFEIVGGAVLNIQGFYSGNLPGT
jgi:hypothetical protein